MRYLTLCAAAVAAVSLEPSHAYTVLTDQHVDVVGITYSSGQGLRSRVHSDSGNFSPAQVLVYDGPSGTTSVSRPGGSQWDFLGMDAGAPVYYWPQADQFGRIYVGFEAEAIAPGTFQSHFTGDPRVSSAGRWLRVELVDVRFFDLSGNPAEAHFSLWSMDGVNPNPVVWMATSDGISESDAFYLLEGGHSHVNWGFSEAGYYQVDFRVSGILAATGQRIESAVSTFHLGVEHLPEAIPEPGVLWLLGGAALAFLRFRNRRNSQPTH